MSDNVSKIIHNRILQKAGDALRQDGWSYTGLFGAKIKVTEKGPVVLGLKCTFQDLGIQTISPLLKSDLYGVMEAATEGRLCSRLPVWTPDGPVASASLRQKGIHIRHQDLEMSCTDAEPVSRDLVSSGETILFSLKDATKQTTVVVFSGTAFRKDRASISVGHQGRNRRNEPYPDETQESTSGPAQAGSTALTDTKQSPSRCVSYIDVNLEQYMDPIFVCTTNSVGEKIKVAQACNLHKLAAQSLVTTCINDLLSKGAQAAYFMPYFAHGNLPEDVVGAIAEGLAEGCRSTGSTLLDREMTQLPGASPDGGYTLFGCAVSVMERRHRLPRLEQMREGDVLIGVQSLGVHSSSLRLLGDILQNHSLQYSSLLPMGNGATTWGEMIMSSDMAYSPSLLHALQSGRVRACIPIAAGGLVGSILRCLPESLAIIIDALCWRIPAVFSWLYKEGGLSEQELVCHFSCGVGAVLIAQGSAAQGILAEVQYEQEAWLMGTLLQHHAGMPRIRVCHLLEALRLNTFQLLKTVIANKSPAKISNVAVLISPTGTKLKIMMETVQQLGSCARLALVISDKTAVEELRRAAAAGIPTRVIDHTMFGCQAEFENIICKVLEEFSIHLICLAGFGRTLSHQFLNRWKGKLLKLYTTLFPPSKGEQRPAADARVCGCTVCFMLDGSPAGPIILQETVVGDSEVPLCEQMEEAEQRAVSKALHLVASGTLTLGVDGHISWKNVE
ncbi:trifunctional purine biosynthetic protein adenosine-3-like [Pseudophryne corroboree]|uniref:trifunctional purine biosynthetic protein adenosine-3-like n=1 Tax=Pseudophryne corroboree TaxID=495146 RepID=UPI003081B1BB